MKSPRPLSEFPHLKILQKLSRIFQTHNYSLYAVGGAVRDFFLKRPITDIDFTTDASPEQMKAILGRVIPTGIQHGTITVLYHSHSFEITTFRVEGEYSNFRAPDSVHYTDQLSEDLERRDFTINAIAIDLLTGEVFDPQGGLADIQQKVLRCVGNPAQRFSEDALRMLRAIRFSSTLGCTIDPDTEAAIRDSANLIQHISRERIRDELKKILLSKTASEGIALLSNSTLFSSIFNYTPDAAVLDCLLQELKSSCSDAISTFHNDEDLFCMRLAICLSPREIQLDTAKDKTGEIHAMQTAVRRGSISTARMCMKKNVVETLENLKISNIEFTLTTCLLSSLRYRIRRPGGAVWSDYKLLALSSVLGMRKSRLLLSLFLTKQEAIHHADSTLIAEYQKRLATLQSTSPFSLSQLTLKGSDILRAFPSIRGAGVGQLLKTALRYAMQHPDRNNRKTLLSYLKELRGEKK